MKTTGTRIGITEPYGHKAGFLWEGLEEIVDRLDLESARLNRDFHPTRFKRLRLSRTFQGTRIGFLAWQV